MAFENSTLTVTFRAHSNTNTILLKNIEVISVHVLNMKWNSIYSSVKQCEIIISLFLNSN